MNGAIDLLEECSLLKIDDLLPWFPDFVVIDKFKDRVVESLEDYNARIDELKSEMMQYTSSAEKIRSEIQALKCPTRRDPRRSGVRAVRPGDPVARVLPVPLLPRLPCGLPDARGGRGGGA